MNNRIQSRAEFLEARREADMLTEGIIGNLIAGVSGWVKGALKGLVSPFTNLVQSIKQDWKDGVSAEKIRDAVTKAIEDSFAAITKQVDQAKEPGEVEQLLQKAIEVNANMANTIKAQLKTIEESFELGARIQAVNEAGVGTSTKVGFEVASKLVDRIMGTSGKALQNVLAKAKEAAKQNVDFSKFKDTVKAEIGQMAKAAKDTIAKMDSQQLLDMKRKGEVPEAVKNRELLKRRQAKYAEGDKATYINNKGEKVVGLVKKDLGDKVEFQSRDDENKTFRKSKDSVVGKSEDDSAYKADEQPDNERFKAGDKVEYRDDRGRDHPGTVTAIKGDVITVKTEEGKELRMHHNRINKAATHDEPEGKKDKDTYEAGDSVDLK